MLHSRTRSFFTSILVTLCFGQISTYGRGQTMHPEAMAKLGEVDLRFLSFNIETVEVTGGRFWKPYKDDRKKSAAAQSNANQPTSMNPSLYEYRAPIDLSNPKLRRLAEALSPAFLRVSGTWRNTTYFQNDDQPPLAKPPAGFNGVMTRSQWKGVVQFAKAVRADIVTSVATSDGVRNADGVWQPEQAQAFFDYNKSIGGHIFATEFMNEPSFAAMGGAPKGYDATAFAKDVKLFRSFLVKESPDTLLMGPGSLGEGVSLSEGGPLPGFITTDDMLRATGPIFDIFSYHFYPVVSRRCAPANVASVPEDALTKKWLDRNLTVEAFYAKTRDEFMPAAPLWLTETGEAACGGDPWASEFLDSFRFMDQLGSLAQRNVKTVMVNTLAASDYGLLDEETLDPRPNYWAALLWKKTMGSRVLNPDVDLGPNTRIYAQCSVHPDGAVAMMILNLDRLSAKEVQVPLDGEVYVLSAQDVLSKTVSLNGKEMRLVNGRLPVLSAMRVKRGTLHIAPLTITFLVFPKAGNLNCR